MPDYFLKKKSLLDRFKDAHGRTGYIQSARAEHTWSNPIKRNRRTKELNGWIKSFAGKKHIRKLARFNTLNNGKNENLEEAMNWINVTDNTKAILKNGSEKSSLNTIEDVVADLAYAQAASNTAFGSPTTAKSILWKAAENFKDSELNFDDNGSFIEDFIVNYEDQFREIYPYAVQNCDWLKLDPDFDKTYNSDDKFPFVEWVISQVAKELFKYAPADVSAKESKGVDEKPIEAIQINTPIVLYKGDAENAAKAHNYLYKKLPRVKGASIASDVKPLGNNKFCRVLFYGSNTGVMKLFGYYSNLFNDNFWNNCDADPQGWVNPLTIAKYDVATPRPESKKHEGFNTTRDLDNFAQHILNYIKDKTHYPGYVRFVKLNDDEEDFYGKYFLAVNGKNYYLYVGDTDYTITDNNDENTLVEGSTDLSGAMNKDLDDFCKRIQQPFYTESKEPAEYTVHSYNDTDVAHYEDGTPEEWQCICCSGLNGGEDGEPFGYYITNSKGKTVISPLCSNCVDDVCDTLNATHGDINKALGFSESNKHEGFVGEWQSKIMQGLEAIKDKYGFDIESDEITDPRHGVTTVYDIIARNNGLTQSLAQVGPEYFHTYTDADFVYSKPFARKDYTDTEAISKLTKVIKDFYSQNPTMARSKAVEPTDEKLSYEKGHKNSKGENAPWVIRSHEDNRILASFANKKDAEEHLKRMKQYSKSESKQNEGLSNEKVKDAVKFAAMEAGLENYLNVDSDGAMSVTVSLPIESDDLKTVRWVIDSNDGTITEYLDTEKNLVRDFTDDESLVSMLTLLFQTSRMELRDWLPKKSEALELETYACYIEFESKSDAMEGMELVTGWTPTRIKNLVVVEGLSKSAAEYLWKDWLDKCTDAGLDIKDKGEVYKDSIDATDKTKSEAHDLDTYKSDVLSDLVVNLFHGEDGAKKLVDEYADAIEDAFARGDTSMEIATEIDTMAGKNESKDVSLKEIARTLDTAINKNGNYSVKDNTSGVTATDKDRTQTIRVSKDLKVELEDKDGKHSYEAQSLRDLSKYIRRAVKGEYVNEDFHKTQVKDAVYDVINRHNLNNAVKVSYLGNSVVCKYADRTLRIQPDLLTTMSTKDGDNVDTYPTNLKELDGYLDRVFGHYADELAESKQSEGIKLKLLDTITVPQWLWDAYLLGNEYGGDLTDDEQTILYDFKEKYKDCHLDDRGEEPDFHSRNDFDCYGGNCYVVDVYTKTDVKEKKSEKLFNKQKFEALAQGADILDQLQYRFSFSFYSPKTYTDAVDTALAMNAEGDKRIAHETIGDSEFRLYTDDPYDAIRFRDGLSNRAGIPAEDLASTFRSAVGIRKNGGYATEAEQDTIGRYAAENYVSFSVSEDNSTMYVEGELPNVVEFFEAISSAEPA